MSGATANNGGNVLRTYVPPDQRERNVRPEIVQLASGKKSKPQETRAPGGISGFGTRSSVG